MFWSAPDVYMPRSPTIFETKHVAPYRIHSVTPASLRCHRPPPSGVIFVPYSGPARPGSSLAPGAKAPVYSSCEVQCWQSVFWVAGSGAVRASNATTVGIG